MKIVFAGTPEFAARSLTALLDAGFDVPLVLTQPDRPAGRGMRTQPSPVKRIAQDACVDLLQPVSLKGDANAVAAIAAIPHDVIVVAAYGLILPQSVLDIPARGCLNIHASLLPRWRGAAPIQRAILAGDAETGVCIMRMEAGLDTGPVLLRAAIPIAQSDTAATLHEKLAALGARLIVDVLRRLDTLEPEPQPCDGVTYAEKIRKAEAALDFSRDASALARQIRAFDPFPGAVADLDGVPVKVWAAVATVNPGCAEPGTLCEASAAGVVIACGGGSALRVSELQKPGGRRLPAGAFLQGFAMAAGIRFTSPAARLFALAGR